MGWTDEEIDEIAREASHHATPEFKQEYWSEMEALLNAEKSSKKGGFWWFFGASSLVLALGVSIYFFTTSKAGVVKSDAEQMLSGKLEFETKTTQEEKNTNNIENNEIVSEEKQKTSAPTLQNFSINPQLTKTSVEVDGNQLIEEVNQGRLKLADNNKGLQNNDELNTVLIHFVDSGEQKNNLQQQNTREQSTDLDLKNNQQSNRDSVTMTNESNYSETLSVADKSQNVEIQTFSEDVLLKRKYGFYIGLNAGAGASYLQNSKDLLIQWGGKIGYDYTFFDKLRLGVGLGFRQQIMKDLVLERNRTYYSLGLINVSQSIQYDRLHFVDLNIHAHYLFRKLAIGIQLTPSYLIGARANLTQIENELGKMESNGLTMEETLFVKTNNLNSFGFDAAISLQYQFKYKMLLDLSISSRLNQLLMNNGFVGNGNAFPLRLELGIIKRF